MSNIVTTTPWLSGDEKPVRIGVYERNYGNGRLFSYWNGKCFCAGAYSIQEAEQNAYIFGCSLDQNLPWRGVMK